MASVVPEKNIEKLEWLRTFRAKFVEEAANLNFDAEYTADILSACDTIEYSVLLAINAKIFSKNCTNFRNFKLKGKRGKAAEAAEIPEFKPPEPPAVLFPSDAVGFLQKAIALMKLQPKYTQALGVGMGIIAPKDAPRDNAEAFPKAKLKALDNGVVRIQWTKGKFDGVIVRSMRGGEETYTEIGRDNYSPFIDTRPPLETGKPEVRRYQLLYMLEDKPVGKMSPIYEVVTNP